MAYSVIAPGYHAGRTAPNKGRTYPAEVLTPTEVETLIKACSNRAPTGVEYTVKPFCFIGTSI